MDNELPKSAMTLETESVFFGTYMTSDVSIELTEEGIKIPDIAPNNSEFDR